MKKLEQDDREPFTVLEIHSRQRARSARSTEVERALLAHASRRQEPILNFLRLLK